MSKASIELKGMTWDHPRGFQSLVASNEMLINESGISIHWDARSLLAFGDQHISEFYEDYDLLIIDHPHVPDAVHARAVLPINQYLSEEQLETLASTSVGKSHDSYSYQENTWALAIDTAAQVSAYRPDKCNGAPVFWNEVLELAADGQVLWPYKPVDAFSTFATLCAQLGSPLYSQQNYLNVDIAASALEIMVKLAGLVPEFCASSNPIDIAERLSSSDQHSVGVCMYGYSNYSRSGFKKHVIIYDDVPSFDGLASGSQLGGAGIAISSAAKNPEAAARAAFYLSEPKIQSSVYGLNGGQPGNLIAWKNSKLNQESNNFFRNTLRTLERAWVRPRLLGWPDVQYQTSLIIHRCLLERKFGIQEIEQIKATFPKYIQEENA